MCQDRHLSNISGTFSLFSRDQDLIVRLYLLPSWSGVPFPSPSSTTTSEGKGRDRRPRVSDSIDCSVGTSTTSGVEVPTLRLPTCRPDPHLGLEKITGWLVVQEEDGVLEVTGR